VGLSDDKDPHRNPTAKAELSCEMRGVAEEAISSLASFTTSLARALRDEAPAERECVAASIENGVTVDVLQ